MKTMKTLPKVQACHFSPALRQRLGLNPREEVKVTVEPTLAEESDPWLAVKGVLTPEEGSELQQLIAASRRSRRTPPEIG